MMPSINTPYQILEDVGMRITEYAFGRSKIFIRNPRSLFDLEDKRKIQSTLLLIKIQAMFRGWMKRTLFKKMKKAQVTISSHYRGFKAKRAYTMERDAAILVQVSQYNLILK